MKRAIARLYRRVTPVVAIITCSVGIGLFEGYSQKAIAQSGQDEVWIQPYNPQPQWQYPNSGVIQGNTSQATMQTVIVNETSSAIPYQLGNGDTAILFPGNAITLSGDRPGSIAYSSSNSGDRLNARSFLQPGKRYRFHMFGDTLNLSN